MLSQLKKACYKKSYMLNRCHDIVLTDLGNGAFLRLQDNHGNNRKKHSLAEQVSPSI